jgi:hypothetical protein
MADGKHLGRSFGLIDAGDTDVVRSCSPSSRARGRARDDEGVALLRALPMDKGMIEAVRRTSSAERVRGREHRGERGGRDDPAGSQLIVLDTISGDGFTPLHLAAFFGLSDAVRLLLARGTLVDRNGTGWMTGTALHAGASGGHASVVRLLLGAGADPNNRQQHGYTPLHSAAANGDLESVELLLDAGADPAAANDEGETALILAEKQDDLVIVERLRDAVG